MKKLFIKILFLGMLVMVVFGSLLFVPGTVQALDCGWNCDAQGNASCKSPTGAKETERKYCNDGTLGDCVAECVGVSSGGGVCNYGNRGVEPPGCSVTIQRTGCCLGAPPPAPSQGTPAHTDTSGPATACNGNVAFQDNESRYAFWNGQCTGAVQSSGSGGIGQGCCELGCGADSQCDELTPGQGNCDANCHTVANTQTIGGTVRDGQGRGVQGVKVWIRDEGSPVSYRGGPYLSVTSGSDGRFSGQVRIGPNGYWVRIPRGNPSLGADNNINDAIFTTASQAYESQPFNTASHGCSNDCNFTVQLVPLFPTRVRVANSKAGVDSGREFNFSGQYTPSNPLVVDWTLDNLSGQPQRVYIQFGFGTGSSFQWDTDTTHTYNSDDVTYTSPAAPVNGGWSDWSVCSVTACGQTGAQTRTCTSPAPANGGNDCSRLDGGNNSKTCSTAACSTVSCTDFKPEGLIPDGTKNAGGVLIPVYKTSDANGSTVPIHLSVSVIVTINPVTATATVNKPTALPDLSFARAQTNTNDWSISSIPVNTLTTVSEYTVSETVTLGAQTSSCPQFIIRVPAASVGGCICSSANTCTSACVFPNKLSSISYADPMECFLDADRSETIPSSTDKNSWCNRIKRTLGDANGDGVIDAIDYTYYLRAVLGGKIPAGVNPDFNGDGKVSPEDLTIWQRGRGQ